MADTAISVDDLIAGLHDIRLPSHVSGGALADIFAALGLGLLLTLLVSSLVPFVTTKIPSRKSKTPSEHLPALDGLSADERARKLFQLIKHNDPEAPILKTANIYAEGGFPDIAQLEQHLKRIELINA